jgi:hypothetical protein
MNRKYNNVKDLGFAPGAYLSQYLELKRGLGLEYVA